MIAEVIEWGITPAIITADSWYASVGTLTRLKNEAWGFLFAIEGNRLVARPPGCIARAGFNSSKCRAKIDDIQTRPTIGSHPRPHRAPDPRDDTANPRRGREMSTLGDEQFLGR